MLTENISIPSDSTSIFIPSGVSSNTINTKEDASLINV